MSDKLSDETTFKAHFPNSLQAVQVHGGGGMRIILEIPESELGNAIDLVRWRNDVLQVTVKKLPKGPPLPFH